MSLVPVLVPALLAALAVATAVAGLTSGSRRRLRAVLPPVTGPARGTGSDAAGTARSVRAACLIAALAAWWVLGGVFGAVAGLSVLVLAPQLLARFDGHDDGREVAAQLPFALDLLAACLSGGAPTLAAVRAVAEAAPGACADRLHRVAASLAVGSPPAEAWHALGADRGPAGGAARALARAADGGAPVAAAVRRVAEDARLEARARAESAARRAGVLAVLPLGLCFLPAFLLLGVVPAVVGLAGPLLASL